MHMVTIFSWKKMDKPEKGANLEDVCKDKQNIVYVYNLALLRKRKNKIKEKLYKMQLHCTKNF